MTCPSCRRSLLGTEERCPECGASLAPPPVEGALAPDPLAVTPPARGKVEPLREIPGLRKREKTWKDEVRERVRHRKHQKSGEPDLPLFREESAPVPDPVPAAMEAHLEVPAGSAAVLDEPDLPLRDAPESLDEQVARATQSAGSRLLEDVPEEEPEPEWSLGASAPAEEPRPVERPALFTERLQAGIIDLALLLVLWSIVVYFASRAAHVDLAGLRPSWRYLGGYLVFLGFVYAAYFTGTTGQTVGKILAGLRVVGGSGRPPGYVRAFLRVAVALTGMALAFTGMIPVFLDPARRAAHDRILKTRVIKG